MLLLPLLAGALLSACGQSPAPDAAAIEKEAAPAAGWTTLGARGRAAADNVVVKAGKPQAWVDYDPPYTHAGLVTQKDITLTMADGTVIALNVTRPTGADGAVDATPLPTLVTFTPYNKNVGGTIPLGGAVNEYFVRHGYNQVFVDVRGTGRSGGSWDPFSALEQADYVPVLDWVVAQPWSNGVVGMWGLSATASTALLAAAKHPSIQGVFAIVPMGDVYRDVVFVGGQASIAFLPAWMAVVTLVATLDPEFYSQTAQYLAAVADHIAGARDFVIRRTVGVLIEEAETAYDNAYWGDKSPLEVAPAITAPTFIVGGLFDIFQRSEPLNYEALKGGTTTKLLMGPWDHLQAAGGEGLPMQGVPVLDRIALMWFDRWLKAERNGAEDLPNVTQWVWGHEQFVTSEDWPHLQARAARAFLQPGGALGDAAPAEGTGPTLVVQQPFNGVCSESSLQISLGLTGYAPLPCWYEDNLAQTLEATFDTPVLEEDLYLNGPLMADLWISTTALNAGLVVRVSDLQPDGTSRALTSGLQSASLRAVDEGRSRYLDGQMIQPWHPFTEESVQDVGSGNVVNVQVEVNQTSALIRKGHQLRISVGASNFPFALMPLPSLVESAAGVLSVYTDASRPSSIVLPVVPAAALE